MIYCIDTSSLISAWNERYHLPNFPPFWQHIENLINQNRLFSPDEVRREITKKSDGLYSWLNDHKDMFIDLEIDIQTEARNILHEFPYLTKQIAGRNSADPFVIALAKSRNYVVVTEEGLGSENKPRIPLVCNHYGIQCINILRMVQNEDWVI